MLVRLILLGVDVVHYQDEISYGSGDGYCAGKGNGFIGFGRGQGIGAGDSSLSKTGYGCGVGTGASQFSVVSTGNNMVTLTRRIVQWETNQVNKGKK